MKAFTNQRLAVVLMAFLLFSLKGIGGDSIAPGDLEFFESKIRPALIENCYQCHSAEHKIKGGLSLDYREGWLAGGDSGPVIIPGDPDASLFIEAIRYHNRDLQMPPKNALPTDVVAALEEWVRRGAPDPREADASTAWSSTAMSIEEGRQFWSFRPLAQPDIPRRNDGAESGNPIDAFVLRSLDDAGLTPAPPADRRTLIRRVTQSLTGLPPTPEEIEAFLADESESAYGKLIDRLLSSPAYGERWGRHWLDVARYADSNGLDENLGFGQAWRYRDYVVSSFNEDKPYDRFIVEQLAGDLVPGADRETRTATGFLALGAKVLAEPDREKLEMDIIDEQLDTMGKAFLAMTFGCVRCHDHKFDPVKHADYYSLAAIFKSTRSLADTRTGAIKHWFEHSFATESEAEEIAKADKILAEKKKAASSFKSKEIVRLRGEARSLAGTYLEAAALISPSTPLTEVEKVAEPLGLHPRILHHCRLHLDYHRDDPFFGKWHEMIESGQTESIAEHFGAIFDETEAAFAEARKENPKIKKLSDPRLEMARAALYDNAGFLAVPTVEAFAFDETTLAEYYRLLEEARAYETTAPDDTAAMGVSEGEIISGMPVHIRGSYRNPGEMVSREFPQVMRTSLVRPIFPENESGRLQLAQWIADTRHPLTARVMVNRIWGWHFGQALVPSTENFGVLGDRPSHPELLDWLSRYFMENGWSIKKLNRLILQSDTYRMSSVHPRHADFANVDPENRLLWRGNLRRLSAEQVRDSILAVTGRLDRRMGGKTLPLRNRQFVFNHTSEDHTKYDSLRRALYLPVIRNHLYPLFEQFNYPDPTMPTGSRNTTTIAPQALVVMNYELVMNSARHFAEALLSPTESDRTRIEMAYESALGRLPTEAEFNGALGFIESLSLEGLTNASEVDSDTRMEAWSLFCQSLLASNEFFYLP